MYPLAEQLWLDWLRDEIKLACTEDEKDAVKDLFERAVHDYLCELFQLFNTFIILKKLFN